MHPIKVWIVFRFFIDVCSIRLDFERLTLADPNTASAVGNDGGRCLTDSLTFTTSETGRTFPTICGRNDGYHGKMTVLISLELRIWPLLHLLTKF